MSLTKDDLSKIKKIVDEGNEYLEAKWDVRFSKLMSSRFDYIDIFIKKINYKIDFLLNTKN